MSRKKHKRRSRRRKVKGSYMIQNGLRVFGLEGCIADTLSDAFKQRVMNQVERKMHIAFADAQFGVVGGNGQHLVVRVSNRNGWMITDPVWKDYPPREIVTHATQAMMARCGISESEARDLVIRAIRESYEACRELRCELQRRRSESRQDRRRHRPRRQRDQHHNHSSI